MGDSDDRLTTLEMIIFDLTSTAGELVEQLRLMNLTARSLSTARPLEEERGYGGG
ncbi:hypothetical protein GIB67_009091 [Kingdonia uniflora]|uniref:Uncharacterized protein n=1 Tax=Kingdonia uniflora TaxID=39325 RepID=A0A7J7MNF7_9MAGN|nr:hypothetical protein GIB67_009091 [Kingdonia uniflora]